MAEPAKRRRPGAALAQGRTFGRHRLARRRRARSRADRAGRCTGAGNLDAARDAEVVVVAVPYAAHKKRRCTGATLPALSGKVLIDITVPLKPPKVRRVQLPAGRAAALEAQALVGPSTPVAGPSITSVTPGSPRTRQKATAMSWSSPTTSEHAAGGGGGREPVGRLGLQGTLDAGPLDNTIALSPSTPELPHPPQPRPTRAPAPGDPVSAGRGAAPKVSRASSAGPKTTPTRHWIAPKNHDVQVNQEWPMEERRQGGNRGSSQTSPEARWIRWMEGAPASSSSSRTSVACEARGSAMRASLAVAIPNVHAASPDRPRNISSTSCQWPRRGCGMDACLPSIPPANSCSGGTEGK